ncbi:winged helix-turn-helix domain-containing protein [Tissierella pigra]|uniref:Uncharacterized protein n=1 Tax=Tissierella pigra TaxID=2607614 RepID=A0A6N7XIH3_9FIRM|nr:hypothetical protein [Tissierella pigra]MBU5425710.1 winged helix-turn-helix domain-containing protein [Tissierella pigra]MSU01871.1 hypothetical protein [Tissierella pigra]
MTSVKRSECIDDITLHEAIKRVINEYGSTTVEEITLRVNEYGLYERKDKKPIPKNQVSARIRKYPDLFIIEDGKVYLNCKNNILSIEAFVGGYFGSSYQVSIDLENNTATYKKLEDGYEIINDREVVIENTEIEKFRSELESIRILKWEKEYFASVLDGTSWSIIIKTADGEFESSGSNSFPRNWNRFCSSIEKIIMSEFR